MGLARASDRLFISARPHPESAAQASDLAWKLRKEHGLRGNPLAAEHLHVTLWHLGDALLPPPRELIEEVVRQMSVVEMPPFKVSFDHVMSFSNGALVLQGEDGVTGFSMLHRQLGALLAARGGSRSSRSFTPHMTLLRDQRHLPLRRIDPAIEWTVSEIVLVHSLLGKTTHRHLAQVPLVNRRPSGRGS